SGTGLPADTGVLSQCLVQTGMDGLVVRSVEVMGDVEEVSGKSGETVGLANRIRIVIAAQGQRDLQVWTNTPLVLPVEAQTIYCYWLRGADREVLRIANSLPVVEA